MRETHGWSHRSQERHEISRRGDDGSPENPTAHVGIIRNSDRRTRSPSRTQSRPMHVVIAGHHGRIHHAAQHTFLQETRRLYCFIPETHFIGGGFQKSRYLESRWPSINTGANPHAIGSHVIPDPGKPVKSRSRCPVLREFLIRLETIAAVKAIPPV